MLRLFKQSLTELVIFLNCIRDQVFPLTKINKERHSYKNVLMFENFVS